MSERYTRLFALEENLYSEGSPVVISAGALLKDNRTEAVLAQLKIRNISRKIIKAAVVRLTAIDAFGKIIDGTVEKEYLDLAVSRDAEFGQKVLIPLPNAAARAFTAVVTCVGFADNTVWNYAGAEQAALPRPKPLSKVLGESELVKQYKIKYGAKAQVFPEEYKDIWICTCGALCHADESFCHTCGNKRAELLPFDREALAAEKDKRLEKEAAARKKAEEEAEAARKRAAEERAEAERLKAEKKAQRAKKAKRIAAVVIPLACVCAALAVLTVKVWIPDKKYNAAAAIMASGDYEAAITAFEALDGYKDSEEQIAACQNAILDEQYDAAMRLLQEEKYEEALEAFRALKGHRDSGSKATFCKDAIREIAYNEAIALFQNGDYREAYAAFGEIPSYKDSLDQRKAILAADPTVEYYYAHVGDTISFGRYEQDNNRGNGKEAIEWTVLAKEENRLLLITKYDIESLPYNSGGGNVTWETCSLRRWLNATFLTTAFTKEEQSLIMKVTVHAEKAPGFSGDPGKDTEDRVFILSGAEAKEFFPKEWDGGTNPTKYVVVKAPDLENDYLGNLGWWVRSPGNDKDTAVFAGPDGLIKKDYWFWVGWNCGVRPVVWITLDS